SACTRGRCWTGWSRPPARSPSGSRPRRHRRPPPDEPEAGANVHVLAQQAPTTQPIPTPPIAWRAIAPELALLVAGVVVILWVAFWPRQRSVPALLTLAGRAPAAGLTAWTWDLEQVAFQGAFAADGITRYARVVLLAAGALATLMAWHESRGARHAPAAP